MSSPVLYYLFSKYSPACAAFGPTMQQIGGMYTVIPIDVDDPMTRQRIKESNHIKSVPCVMVHNGPSVKIYENQELVQFITDLLGLMERRVAEAQARQQAYIPQQQQPMYPVYDAPPPPPTPVASIVNPAFAQQPAAPLNPSSSFNAALNQRLAPQVFDAPPPPQPIVTHQIQQTSTATQQAQQMMQAHQQMQPAVAQVSPPMPPQQGGIAPAVIEPPMVDQGIPIADNTFVKGPGLSPEEIGQNVSRGVGQASNVMNDYQRMARERDEEMKSQDAMRGPPAQQAQFAQHQQSPQYGGYPPVTYDGGVPGGQVIG